MSELSYRNSKTSWKELIVFILVEALVVVWGAGTWIYFNNPYQQVAVLYAMATVTLDLIQHMITLAFTIQKVVRNDF